MRTSRLYHQLCDLLGQSSPWADQRHLQTLIWMVIGVICSECISLTKWGVYVRSRARFAQSHQRRFSRWLHNSRINVQRLYSPTMKLLKTSGTLLSGWLRIKNSLCCIRVPLVLSNFSPRPLIAAALVNWGVSEITGN